MAGKASDFCMPLALCPQATLLSRYRLACRRCLRFCLLDDCQLQELRIMAVPQVCGVHTASAARAWKSCGTRLGGQAERGPAPGGRARAPIIHGTGPGSGLAACCMLWVEWHQSGTPYIMSDSDCHSRAVMHFLMEKSNFFEQMLHSHVVAVTL